MPVKNLRCAFLSLFKPLFFSVILVFGGCSDTEMDLNVAERQEESRAFVRSNQILRLLIAFQSDSSSQFLPKTAEIIQDDTIIKGKNWIHLKFTNSDFCADGVLRTGNINLVTHRNAKNVIDSIWAYSTFADSFGVDFGGRISRFQGNFFLYLNQYNKWKAAGDFMEKYSNMDLIRTFNFDFDIKLEDDFLNINGGFGRKYGLTYTLSEVEFPFYNRIIPIHGLLSNKEAFIDFDPINNRAFDRFMKLNIDNSEFPFEF